MRSRGPQLGGHASGGLGRCTLAGGERAREENRHPQVVVRSARALCVQAGRRGGMDFACVLP